jgi:hypothetical protein
MGAIKNFFSVPGYSDVGPIRPAVVETTEQMVNRKIRAVVGGAILIGLLAVLVITISQSQERQHRDKIAIEDIAREYASGNMSKNLYEFLMADGRAGVDDRYTTFKEGVEASSRIHAHP